MKIPHPSTLNPQPFETMLSKFDIQKLNDLNIEDVADALGLEVKRHKALCPFHDDNHPSLTFSTFRNRYRCYVCDARGGSIDLVMNYNHLSFYDACAWLAKEFGIYLPEVGVREVRKVRKVQKRPLSKSKGIPQPSALNLHYLESLISEPDSLNPEAMRFLFEERRLDPQVVTALGLSSISSPAPMTGNPNGLWFNAPSLLIPYRDINGKLLSVQARYLGPTGGLSSKAAKPQVSEVPEVPSELPQPSEFPRFQFPKGSRCSIYNLPILKNLRPGEPLFVTEGCSDCWSMLSSGHKAIAIPSATLLQESDLKVLEKFVVHIYPDNDKAGEGLYDRLVQASLRFGFTLVRHQLPADCKDFSDYYLQKLKPETG